MVTNFRMGLVAGLALLLWVPTLAKAQDINLAAGGADQIWRGAEPGARAGLWFDQGPLSTTESRRDLIVGAPGNATIPGSVYVIFGGPLRSGNLDLATQAETVINSTEAGNQFGFSTAAGNVRNAEGSLPRNLVVGAPGQPGARGAVYLFNGGFSEGDSFTEANATVRILGAPGDRLGTALATGDLDKDGFREIIIGAQGNNRVYIIHGGPALSGTIDLASTPAHRTIAAPGIGTVLATGDINNDNITDLLIGAPSANLLYVFNGQNGTVPAGAGGAFLGIDAGDAAGTAIRVLDLNGDGRRDLAVSAPTADGPGNTRPDSGEVYVFLGPVNTSGQRSLGEANIFFNAPAGFRLGTDVTTGDINRDLENDLVMLAPGASSAGRAVIYYGRSSGSIGVPAGAARVVDFAAAGQASRNIIGDPAVGAIENAQVFEVTGEGARDIIVGIPSADSGSGRLYFTISPKLRVSPRTVNMFVGQGGTASSSAISVLNPSIVGISWQTSSNQPWLSASVASGTADHTSPASFRINVNAAGLSGGTHSGRVNVTSTSPDLEMTIPVNVTLTVTGARIVIDTPAQNASVTAPATLSGWALDTSAPSGTGVDNILLYAYPNPGSGAAPVFVGTASYGAPRGDVGGIFGARFTNSGYSVSLNSLRTGTYFLVAFARSTVSNSYTAWATRNISMTNPNPAPAPVSPGPPPAGGPTPTANPNTRVSINRSALYFAAVQNGAVRTPQQNVMVNFTNGSAAWTATTTATWLEILGGSGTGSGTFLVRIKAGTYLAGLVQTSSITVTANGVANSPLTLPVTFRSLSVSTIPKGSFDTPLNNATGVTGALPMTGWALDDVEVRKVLIYRDKIPAEGAGHVFIGTATFVDGARPDVEAANAMPLNFRAGWGYMLLTNMLPSRGNGTFRLHAFAEDAEGKTVLLGTRTVTCTNASATRPFGTIDTPDQGGTVSGTYSNWGWALAPQPNRIPTDGSTIMVFIDGVPVGRPTYNLNRPDIAGLFPGLQNSNGAIGHFSFDTTTLANGVHTIAWGVSDNNGNAAGLGSRYFTVANGSAASSLTVAPEASIETLTTGQADVREAAPIGAATGASVVAVAALPKADTPSYVRSGFDPGAPLNIVDAGDAGERRVTVEEMERLEVTVGSPISDPEGGYEGYLVGGGTLKELPQGSFLDRRTGEFFWQLGVGYVGQYEFVFVRTENGVKQRIPVSVTIEARKPGGLEVDRKRN